VIVGKAFGGMLLMDLIRKGYWRGPSVLLSPAAVPGIDDLTLAPNMPILIVYGGNDSRALSSPSVCKQIWSKNSSVKASDNSESSVKIELVEVDDTYELNSIINNDVALDGTKNSSDFLASMIEKVHKIGSEHLDKSNYLPKFDDWNKLNNKGGKAHSPSPTKPNGCCSIS
jgi:hypothetical protein